MEEEEFVPNNPVATFTVSGGKGGRLKWEKHDILSNMRSKGHHASMRGEFAHSVLSRVANLGRGISHADHPMLLAQHQWLERALSSSQTRPSRRAWSFRSDASVLIWRLARLASRHRRQ